jgi:hypothetical protein
VTYTLKDAQQNGWEEFIKREKNEEIIMPASELKEGVHVFPMTGKTMTMAQAMSLSKYRYSPATGKGDYAAMYEEFSEEYERAKVAMEAPEWLAPPAPIRKTAAQKEAETAEKKRLAEEKKAQKKEEREKAKEETKNAKTSEKEAAKAAKVPKVPKLQKQAKLLSMTILKQAKKNPMTLVTKHIPSHQIIHQNFVNVENLFKKITGSFNKNL